MEICFFFNKNKCFLVYFYWLNPQGLTIVRYCHLSGDDQADPESDFPNFRLLFAIFWKSYRESTGKPCAHRERARRELSKTFEILKIGPVALEKSSFKHRNKIGKF